MARAKNNNQSEMFELEIDREAYQEQRMLNRLRPAFWYIKTMGDADKAITMLKLAIEIKKLIAKFPLKDFDEAVDSDPASSTSSATADNQE